MWHGENIVWHYHGLSLLNIILCTAGCCPPRGQVLLHWFDTQKELIRKRPQWDRVIFENLIAVAYPVILFGGGGAGFSKFSWGQRAERTGIWSGVPFNLQSGSSLSNFQDVEGCYGCIFHGTGNSVQLCQNFRISEGGFEPPQPPPLGTPLPDSFWTLK
jgi:hypothetical protein